MLSEPDSSEVRRSLFVFSSCDSSKHLFVIVCVELSPKPGFILLEQLIGEEIVILHLKNPHKTLSSGEKRCCDHSTLIISRSVSHSALQQLLVAIRAGRGWMDFLGFPKIWREIAEERGLHGGTANNCSSRRNKKALESWSYLWLGLLQDSLFPWGFSAHGPFL